LEERCNSYQNDLYELRGQLLSLQSDFDHSEESSAKLNDQITQILHSDFIIDGHSVLPMKLKHPSHIPDETHILISTLRHLSSLWKDLVEKKATLERTVTKLSAQKVYHSPELKVVDEPATPIEFFPPKVDSFGLETIIEDERGEEDGPTYDTEVKDESSKIGFNHPPTLNERPVVTPDVVKDISSSSTQTDQPDETDAIKKLEAQIFASIESTFLEKEKGWIQKVSHAVIFYLK